MKYVRLTSPEVRAILCLYENCEWTTAELAEVFGVSTAAIHRAVTGKAWPDITHGQNISRVRKDTEFRCAVIEARLEQGVRNYRAIAEELGISRQAVSKLVRTKGLGGTA